MRAFNLGENQGKILIKIYCSRANTLIWLAIFYFGKVFEISLNVVNLGIFCLTQ